MAAQLLTSLFLTALDGNGRPISGAKLYFYVTGTTTPASAYTTSALSVAHPSPLVADAAGRFAAVYLDATVSYRAKLFDATDVIVRDIDPLNESVLGQLAASGGAGLVGAIDSGAGAVAETVQADYRRGKVYPHRFAAADTLGLGNDDSVAFQAALTAAAGRELIIPYVAAGYKINTPLVIPANTRIVGHGATLYTTVNGQHIASATSVGNVTVQGVLFQGSNSATVPLAGFGGQAAANTGLLTITNCTDVRVRDCEFNTFYNGLTVQKCTRAWVENNRVRNFKLIGILGSLSSYGYFFNNTITDSTQTGATFSYGIQVTGDEAGGNQETYVSILHNKIVGMKSWDGIMSHDVTNLSIIGNQIDDVRTGIDVGHFAATNIIRRVVIANNIVNGTTSDTWATVTANSGGILVIGYDATHRVSQVSITGNTVSNFFNNTGMTGTPGISSNITVAYADDVTVSGNTVNGAGNAYTNAGILITGTVNRVTALGNSLQGQMASGGIRTAALTSDMVTIGGGSISQGTTSDPAINVNAGTIASLAVVPCATNSTQPFATSGSTIGYAPGAGPVYKATSTYDPPSLVDGAGVTTTVTVTGSSVGDPVDVGFSNDLQGMTVTGYVNASNSVAVRFQNESGGTIDLASGALTVLVRKI